LNDVDREQRYALAPIVPRSGWKRRPHCRRQAAGISLRQGQGQEARPHDPGDRLSARAAAGPGINQQHLMPLNGQTPCRSFGIESARARVEMKAAETILHLRRERPQRMKSMIPEHVWTLVEPYGLAPESGESPSVAHQKEEEVRQP